MCVVSASYDQCSIFHPFPCVLTVLLFLYFSALFLPCLYHQHLPREEAVLSTVLEFLMFFGVFDASTYAVPNPGKTPTKKAAEPKMVSDLASLVRVCL